MVINKGQLTSADLKVKRHTTYSIRKKNSQGFMGFLKVHRDIPCFRHEIFTAAAVAHVFHRLAELDLGRSRGHTAITGDKIPRARGELSAAALVPGPPQCPQVSTHRDRQSRSQFCLCRFDVSHERIDDVRSSCMVAVVVRSIVGRVLLPLCSAAVGGAGQPVARSWQPTWTRTKSI